MATCEQIILGKKGENENVSLKNGICDTKIPRLYLWQIQQDYASRK